MYVCIYVHVPIPSRSGRDDVGTCSKTPVDDDGDIGKCDVCVFLFNSVGARWGGSLEVDTSGTSGTSSKVFISPVICQQKKASSSGTRFTSCEQPTHASNE